MAAQQRIVTFSGNVQGVGFRYAACRMAAAYDVTGYVRNLPDGQVECLIEGESAQIDALVADIRQEMSHYIRNVSQQKAPAGGQFHGFGIRH